MRTTNQGFKGNTATDKKPYPSKTELDRNLNCFLVSGETLTDLFNRKQMTRAEKLLFDLSPFEAMKEIAWQSWKESKPESWGHYMEIKEKQRFEKWYNEQMEEGK